VQIQSQLVARANRRRHAREALADLQAGVTRATRLAEQLLALARSEPDGHSETQCDRSARAARRMRGAYAPLAQQRGVDLGIEASEPASVITAMRTRCA
jgi:two-component system OmpR family sensor kinase